MRHPGDNNAGPSAGRPRDPAAAQTPGRRGQAGTGRARSGQSAAGRQKAGQARSGPDPEQSVFVPGYRNQRPAGAAGHHAAEPGTPGGPWPSADGSVGKGPVRGFPPGPGQPPPLYPPGQFAAWNRLAPADRDSDAGTRRAVPAADAGWSGGARDDGGQQPGQARYGGGPGGQGAGQDGYVPGYSALAVSDPAADVTSTQAWQAVGDGPGGTGAESWADPRGQAGPLASPGSPAAGRTAAPRRPATAGPDADGAAAPGSHSPGSRAAGSHTSGSRAAGSRAGSRAAGSRPAGPRAPGSRSSRSPRKRRGPSSAVLAVCTVAVLAVAAGTFLFLTARHGAATAAISTPSPSAPAGSTPAPTSSTTLGPYGHIATRTADPLPLTITQLFPRTFTANGASFVRTTSQTRKSCTSALTGMGLQAAAKRAKCTQAIRATYMSASAREMGTIGVLNLSSAKAAKAAGHAAGRSDYIDQLKARKGATHDLGKGAGVEEAAAKGHYLILIWAQFTGRHDPKTVKQRKLLAIFMSELFQQTANISLTSRMVNGSP